MNGHQQRSKEVDYAKINPVKSIEEIKDYRGYKRILFLRPFSNTYMGYLDNHFFGFTVREGDNKHWLMDAREAVDHYLDNTFFHNSGLEYSTFFSKPIYRGYLNSLKLKFDKGNNDE